MVRFTGMLTEGLRQFTLWDEVKTWAGGLGNIAWDWRLVGGIAAGRR